MIFGARSTALAVALNPFGYRIALLKRKRKSFSIESLVAPGFSPGEMNIDFATAGDLPSELLNDIAQAVSSMPRARTAVVLPDRSVRIVNFSLAELPADPADAARIINWQIKQRFSIDMQEYMSDIKVKKIGSEHAITVTLAPFRIVEPLRKKLAAMRFEVESVEPATAAMVDLAAVRDMWPEPPVIVLGFDAGSLTIAHFSSGGIRMYRTIRLAGPEFSSSAENMRKLAAAWSHSIKESPPDGARLIVLGEHEYFTLNSSIISEITGMNPILPHPGVLSGLEGVENAEPWLSSIGALEKVFR